jgi:hypothetical protein
MSSLTSSQPSISSTRDQRIEAVLLKIKSIRSAPTAPPHPTPKVESAPSAKYVIPSRRTPSPPPQLPEKYLIPSRRTPSPPPQVPETAPYSPIFIIYSAETHQCRRSPPPKGLLPTFPCPPEIELPRETKISLPGGTRICSRDVMDERHRLTPLVEPIMA